MTAHSARFDMRFAMLALLVVGLGLRLFLLTTPAAELDADEAVVGLMASHILRGERPIFYYQQPYMGSLEAYLASLPFALLGASATSLKTVPLLLSLLFVILVFATGRRLGGARAALFSAAYVAIPPAFLALWGLKARGGYIEILVIGQALILIALNVVERRRVGMKEAVLGGALTGIGIWTNLLIAVYLLPIAIYVALVLRRKVIGTWLIPAALALALGALPLLAYNLQHDLATAGAISTWRAGMSTVPKYTFNFFRHSLPVLAGLAQGSTSQELFWPAFGWSLARWWPVAFALGAVFILPFAVLWRSLLALLRGRDGGADGRNLMMLILIVVPAAFVLTKFHEPVSEPRYLLPLYSAIPLLAAGVTSTRMPRIVAPVTLAALMAVNLFSLAALDPAMNRPQSAATSTPANRLELAEFLTSNGLSRIYTDYWLAYPLAFESRETILPSVASGGFNRYIPYAHEVSVSPAPAFVFVAGSKEEANFAARLAGAGATAVREAVSIYSVYSGVAPLEPLRP